MLSKSKVKVMSIILVALLALTGCGSEKTGKNSSGNADKIVLIAGHTLAPEHPYQKGFEKMDEIIKEKTNSQIELEIHASSELGEEQQMLEALQMGTIALTTTSAAPMTGFVKDYMVCDFPFIFKTVEDAYKFYDGEFGEALFKKTEPIGLIGLAWWDNGFRNFTNSKRPITSPDDMKGLKMRTMNSPVHMASVQAIGASAVPISFGELYSALQQGVVDGQENPVANIYNNRFYEVQKYLTLSKHFYDPSPLYISKKVMDTLTDEQQKIVKDAAIVARDYMRQLLNDEQAQMVDELKGKGMTVTELNDQQFATFQTVTKDVYKQFESEISKDILDMFKKLTGLQ